MLYEVLEGIIGIELALGGFFLGLFLGFIATRMFIIHWHEERAKVVSRFDTIGIFVMLLYIAFSASRTWLFGHWIHGSVLTAFTYSILAGVMIGRIVGMLNPDIGGASVGVWGRNPSAIMLMLNESFNSTLIVRSSAAKFFKS
ncbi:MAG: hypothetical protein J5U19_16020 [Candidatus Methanoperedens sp.]|nr:hypothetical protein [Candidatus Methanoperedens sp.]